MKTFGKITGWRHSDKGSISEHGADIHELGDILRLK